MSLSFLCRFVPPFRVVITSHIVVKQIHITVSLPTIPYNSNFGLELSLLRTFLNEMTCYEEDRRHALYLIGENNLLLLTG